MKTKRTLALLLLAAMLATTACAEKASENDAKQTDAPLSEGDTTPETEPDPLADLNYDGRSFRIYTSTNDPGGVGNSNYLIEGPEEETGDIVNDAVFKRNARVEEDLGVDLVFDEVDLVYTEVATRIRKLISTNDDAYDLVINDLFPLAALVLEGSFVNAYDGEYFNFEKNYWYKNFMQDVAIGNDAAYILAGDFFIDMIRSAHGLIFNKSLMTNDNVDYNELYNAVLDHKWTLDLFNETISKGYKDLNGNGKRDGQDQYGYVALQIWGPSIPFIISADPDFIERDEDGIPSISINNEKAVALLEKLYNIFYNDASNPTLADYDKVFEAGQSYFMGYQRLGSLEDLREMEQEIGILPYPMLDENQADYVTSVHDTTEIGVIPITVTDLSFISAVTEDLCRRTNEMVLPNYYETALKVKYARGDDNDAKMIDIIHDHTGNGFVLAYDDVLNQILMKNVFYVPLEAKNTNFASAYKRSEKAALKKLDKMIDNFLKATNGQ